ncbi:MAG: hypothetical protein HQL09_02930 [Nitrospirae bacterium]|nr:hypothetical protein [Nitrospirota bacterium]
MKGNPEKPEKTGTVKDGTEDLEERVSRLARDKSCLQLINRMMEKLSAVPGLANTMESMLTVVLDCIGGTNVAVYYLIDDTVYYADVYGKKMKIASIDDQEVKKVFDSREPLEIEHDFSDTKMMTPEFTKAFTWVFPLLVGTEIVGVFKIEDMHMGMRELRPYLPTFFNYVALILRNEILGQTRLKKAFCQLNETNVALSNEIIERKRAEEALRKSNEELERKNAELETMNKVFVGREIRMVELKERIKELEFRIQKQEDENKNAPGN